MATKKTAAKKNTSGKRGVKDLTAKDAKSVKGGRVANKYKVE